MRKVKRIEIVLGEWDLSALTETLASVGVKAYTLTTQASGQGRHGMRHSDELTGASSNIILVTTCEPEQWPSIAEAIRPLLKSCGGMCLVSDAEWLIHEKE